MRFGFGFSSSIFGRYNRDKILLSVWVFTMVNVRLFDFCKEQSKFVNEGRITQTCLKLDDVTMHIRKGEIYDIFFDNIRLSDKFLMVEKVRKTNLYRLSSRDIQKNGFEYRPFFIEHYARKGISEDDSVVAVDFSLIDRSEK